MKHAQYYLNKFGGEAAKHFVDDLFVELCRNPDLSSLAVDDAAMTINGASSSDNQIVRCSVCGLYTLWGGNDDDATVFVCDKCCDTFCSNCRTVREDDERVLCPQCASIKE